MQFKILLIALVGCCGLVDAAAITETGLSVPAAAAAAAATSPSAVVAQADEPVTEGEAMEAKKKVKTQRIRDPDTTTTVTTTVTSTGNSTFPTTTSSFTTTYVTTYTSVIGSSGGAGRGYTSSMLGVGGVVALLTWTLL